MLKKQQQSAQIGMFDLMGQIDKKHKLVALANQLDWQYLEDTLSQYYCLDNGAPAKPIRLMSGLLMLKQLYDLSDESVVEQWLMNPYFQYFCGMQAFSHERPCHPSDLTKFRQRIGEEGVNAIFFVSVKLHDDKQVEEKTVIVDSTVQEKNITYPTDSKFAITIINRLNKLAKANGIKQRRTYVKEVKSLRLACRNFNHPKRRKAARKALKRLRVIAFKLMRELQRRLSPAVLTAQEANFALYTKVLTQQPKDKNKIYSLHEPQVYCVGKGKDHKPYEYGAKASIVTTLKSAIIVGFASHDKHEHDSKCLKPALDHAMSNRQKAIKTAVVDRGYRGCKNKVDVECIIPSPPLKRDSDYQKQRKRVLCRKRSAVESVIGHLKNDYRMRRNYLKGSLGDVMNLAMACAAWNLKKWLNGHLLPLIFVVGRLKFAHFQNLFKVDTPRYIHF